MSLRTLIEKLTAFRCERPSEWLMDEYIRDATALEQEIERLKMELASAHQEGYDQAMKERL